MVCFFTLDAITSHGLRGLVGFLFFLYEGHEILIVIANHIHHQTLHLLQTVLHLLSELVPLHLPIVAQLKYLQLPIKQVF